MKEYVRDVKTETVCKQDRDDTVGSVKCVSNLLFTAV